MTDSLAELELNEIMQTCSLSTHLNNILINYEKKDLFRMLKYVEDIYENLNFIALYGLKYRNYVLNFMDIIIHFH